MSPEVITAPANKVTLSGNNALAFKLVPPNFSRRYGFTISHTTSKSNDEIKYEVKVTYLKDLTPEVRLFKIDRLSTVYINGVEPDAMADQLAYAAGKVFYPLIIEVNLQGEFLQINNYAEIASRWVAKKEELQEYYEREIAEKYLSMMDDAVADKYNLDRAFRNDLFISVYFSGIYKSYGQALKVSDELRFPVASPATPARYFTEQEVSVEFNEYNDIELHHHGTLRDDRSITDFEQGLDYALSKIDNPDIPSATGVYNGLYVLNAATKAIETVIINISLELTETKNFNLKLFRIEEKKVKTIAPVIPEGQSQLLIIDGQTAADDRQTNIFTKFMDSLFGK